MAHRQRVVTPSQTLSSYEYIKRVVISILCIYILYIYRVIPIMFTAKERNTTCLYLALIMYGTFAVMWIYCALFFQRKDLYWYERHQHFIYTATVIAVVASVFLIAAMWPVFGVTAILFFFDALIIVVHVVGLLPSTRPKVM